MRYQEAIKLFQLRKIWKKAIDLGERSYVFLRYARQTILQRTWYRSDRKHSFKVQNFLGSQKWCRYLKWSSIGAGDNKW